MSVFRSLMAAQSTAAPSQIGGYITDGLVFMLDGIWNDAIGEPQNPSLGGIRDLVSGQLIKFKVPYKCQFHDRGLTVLSGDKNTVHSISLDTGIPVSDFSGMTVEQVDTPIQWQFTDAYSVPQSVVTNSFLAFQTLHPVSSSVVYSSDHDSLMTYYYQGKNSMVPNAMFKPSVIGNPRHLSCVMSSCMAPSLFIHFPTHCTSIRLNGKAVTSFTDNAFKSTSPVPDTLSVQLFSNSRMDFHLHSYRIYNRPLTAKEQAHNYAIDLARFSL